MNSKYLKIEATIQVLHVYNDAMECNYNIKI